ncbi:MAG TPA: aldo/keto reductase [Bryobacteraceae bacterium]|nr:aldo/keto reductase [Bryobacteraceae bacterium]
MTTRKLGASGLEVSTLCLGGNVFGWTADEPASFQILDAFLAAGCNFIDTADVYSRWVPGHKGGESELVLGNWFKRSGNRVRVIVATKVGIEMAPDKKGLSKHYILRAVEESLQRLQTDYIDLYQSHIDDANTPLEETLEAYDRLIRQGKVRAIGASNYTGERLAAAIEVSEKHGLPKYQCLQPHYNLIERAGYEKDLEPLCLKHGIGVIPYFALAGGFLTGKYRSEADLSKSPRGMGVKKYLNERGMRVLGALDQVAKQYSSTPGKVAVAWLIARPSITAAIASATSVDQLNDLIDATRLHLDQASIDLLNNASA